MPGRGAEPRTCDGLAGMLGAMLTLTPVTLADTPLIERWLTDAESRRWLHARGVAWLADVEDVPEWDAGRITYLAHSLGEPVGVIDLTPEMGVVWLNLMVAPTVRGRGIGRQMISAVRTQPAHADDELCALIAPGNHASIRCLSAAGFVRDASRDCDDMLGFALTA